MPENYRWPTEVIQYVETHLLIEVGTIVSLYPSDDPDQSRKYQVAEILSKNPKRYQVRLELIP
jgi:hypothetical protein